MKVDFYPFQDIVFRPDGSNNILLMAIAIKNKFNLT